MIIYGERTTTADVLLDACDHALSWIFDVLQRPTNDEDLEEPKLERTDEQDKNGGHVNLMVGGRNLESLSVMETDRDDDITFLSHQQSTGGFLGTERSTSSIYNHNGTGSSGSVDMIPLSREASLSEAREVCMECQLTLSFIS